VVRVVNGLRAPTDPVGYAAAIIHDLITAFLVAFAAVAGSELTRIWESF
jgi:hypothetical protein